MLALIPHIMTRTSSHEPNQLIHAGPTLLPPSSSPHSPPARPGLLPAKLHYTAAARGCCTTVHSLLSPSLLPNYLLINYRGDSHSICTFFLPFFFTAWSAADDANFPPKFKGTDISALAFFGHIYGYARAVCVCSGISLCTSSFLA